MPDNWVPPMAPVKRPKSNPSKPPLMVSIVEGIENTDVLVVLNEGINRFLHVAAVYAHKKP